MAPSAYTAPQMLDTVNEVYTSFTVSSFQITYAKFREWECMVYPGTAPLYFASKWLTSIEEVYREWASPRCYLFPLLHFLRAVGTCPETHPWLGSLQIRLDAINTPKDALDSTIAEFVAAENARIRFKREATRFFNTMNNQEDQSSRSQGPEMNFCPYHRRPVQHSMDECRLNPNKNQNWSAPASFTTADQQGAMSGTQPLMSASFSHSSHSRPDFQIQPRWLPGFNQRGWTCQ